MGDDIINIQQKRNTDCVYFLASPLTCKKGLECEYRHNEIARLNPRDCWFWLAGNCLNPTCAFRHPPLEMHAEVPLESSSSAPANKTNVPCYFYFNGFCNKGDRCSFVHGHDANMPTGASGTAASAIKEDILLDSKISVGNRTASAPKEPHAVSFEAAAKAVMDLKMQNEEDFQPPASENNVIRSPSPQIAAFQYEEAVALKPGFLLRAESFTESRTHVYTEESSEEEMDGHFEAEERWESSPGFDVLVNDKSENLGYEDDQEYLLPLDRGQIDLNNHILGYDFENLVEYDPACHDAEDDYEGGNYEYADFVDNMRILDDVGSGSGLRRNPMSGSLLYRKRKLVATELSVNDKRADLRDRLGKRRVIDVQPLIRSSRRHYGSRLHGQSQGSFLGPGSKQPLHGRLALEVRNNASGPHHKNGNLSFDTKRPGWHRHSRLNMCRQRHKEKRMVKKQYPPSEILRKPKEKKSNQEPTQFTGPKTLAQIKEEKKRAEENVKAGNSSRMATADFESPKPLSEILKCKRRLSSA